MGTFRAMFVMLLLLIIIGSCFVAFDVAYFSNHNSGIGSMRSSYFMPSAKAISKHLEHTKLRLTRQLVINDYSEDSLKPVHGLVLSTSNVEGEEQKVTEFRYKVSLSSIPTSKVTVSLVDDSSCLKVFPKNIEFSPKFWNLAQIVSVSSAKLSAMDSKICSHSNSGLVHQLKSNDKRYDGMHVKVPFNIQLKSIQHAPSIRLHDRLQHPSSVLDTSKINPDSTHSADNVDASDMKQRVSVDISRNEEFKCEETELKNNAHYCKLSNEHGTLDFYVIDPISKAEHAPTYNEYPLVFVVGGVHGNEGAGWHAAEFVANNWTVGRGRLVVLPHVNKLGTVKNTRYIPGTSTEEHDLNRDFPANLNQLPKGGLAKNVWRICDIFKPDVLFDLHEGWGYYAQLRKNPHAKLVGSKSFSKGSSIIATESSVPIASKMLESVNHSIKSSKKLFYLITPPVSGGLANRAAVAFGTKSMVLETTKKEPLPVRVSQHLTMLKRGFEVLHLDQHVTLELPKH